MVCRNQILKIRQHFVLSKAMRYKAAHCIVVYTATAVEKA
jgi:hypothetical protein